MPKSFAQTLVKAVQPGSAMSRPLVTRFFGAKKIQKPSPPPMEIPKTTRFAVPPDRPMMDPGEFQDYEVPPPKLYDEFISRKKPSPTARSCYFSIEKSGKVYHVFDAQRLSYGRICQKIAFILQGKHKPIYKPGQAVYGDICIVVNAGKVKLTGRKKLYKVVRYHTGYPGSLREIPFRDFIEEKPEQLMFLCVSKMLPKNKLRPEWLENLYVFRGPEHTFTNIVPNFVPQVEESLDSKYDFNEKQGVVIYETSPEGEEFKDRPREIDPILTVPFHQRSEYIANTPKNRRLQAKMIAFEKRIAKRFKEYTFKKRKDKIKDLSNTVDPVYINSEAMAKRYNLTHYVPPEDHEDDDDVDEAPPKRK